jgi:putative N6-adenine-specific DNA methylase
MEIFATCQPGIEPFLHREIFDLGLTEEIPDQHQHAGEGGIAFQGSLNSLYQANLWLRTATRVLVRLGRFHALQFAELRKKAASLPWEEYLHPGQPVAIHTTCHRSKLYHSGAVSERISGAIGDRLKKQPDIFPFAEEGPSPQRVVARLDHDECTISLDTSGEPLYRRGYRLAVAKAQLRENLAAAMLCASG